MQHKLFLSIYYNNVLKISPLPSMDPTESGCGKHIAGARRARGQEKK
jgi:hypothetical protein